VLLKILPHFFKIYNLSLPFYKVLQSRLYCHPLLRLDRGTLSGIQSKGSLFLKSLNIFYIALFCLIFTNTSSAGGLIRDAQTERFLYKISNPIFKSAGLDSQIKLHIINDNSINAFVSGGKNIYINTGTILLFKDPLGLLGVIAHETGHVSGSHLARQSIDIERLNKQMALGMILGIGAALGGSPEAAQAVILGNSHIAERQFYSFTKKHEESADEAALRYLDANQVSSTGLLDFFKEIKSLERSYTDDINPYTRTHPLTESRISRVSNHIKESSYSKLPYDSKLSSEFEIIYAKINSFLNNPQKILSQYKLDNDAGKIAHIIALHRLGRTEDSLNLFKRLEKNRRNPYIRELKAQIYYESGQAKRSVGLFREVNKELPDEPLIKIQLASAIISLGELRYFPEAIESVNLALLGETNNALYWRTLAELHGKLEEKAMSFLALAEASYHSDKMPLAIKYAKKAKKLFKEDNNQKHLLRIEDIIKLAKLHEKRS
jgi:predicted Zn-dependent protease